MRDPPSRVVVTRKELIVAGLFTLFPAPKTLKEVAGLVSARPAMTAARERLLKVVSSVSVCAEEQRGFKFPAAREMDLEARDRAINVGSRFRRCAVRLPSRDSGK